MLDLYTCTLSLTAAATRTNPFVYCAQAQLSHPTTPPPHPAQNSSATRGWFSPSSKQPPPPSSKSTAKETTATATTSTPISIRNPASLLGSEEADHGSRKTLDCRVDDGADDAVAAAVAAAAAVSGKSIASLGTVGGTPTTSSDVTKSQQLFSEVVGAAQVSKASLADHWGKVEQQQATTTLDPKKKHHPGGSGRRRSGGGRCAGCRMFLCAAMLVVVVLLAGAGTMYHFGVGPFGNANAADAAAATTEIPTVNKDTSHFPSLDCPEFSTTFEDGGSARLEGTLLIHIGSPVGGDANGASPANGSSPPVNSSSQANSSMPGPSTRPDMSNMGPLRMKSSLLYGDHEMIIVQMENQTNVHPAWLAYNGEPVSVVGYRFNCSIVVRAEGNVKRILDENASNVTTTTTTASQRTWQNTTIAMTSTTDSKTTTATTTRLQLGRSSVRPTQTTQTTATTVAPRPATLPARLYNVTQPRKMAVIFFTFSNDPTEPMTTDQAIYNLFENNRADNVNEVFSRNSRGRVAFQGRNGGRVDAFGWYRLRARNNESCPSWDWSVEALAMSGIKANDYQHVLFIPNAAPKCPFGGLAYLSHWWLMVRGEYLTVWANDLAYAATHEASHNLGLHHSGALTCAETTMNGANLNTTAYCGANEYGDRLDVMGSSNTPPYHFYARHLFKLGWVADSSLAVLKSSGTSGTSTTTTTTTTTTTLILRPADASPSLGVVAGQSYLAAQFALPRPYQIKYTDGSYSVNVTHYYVEYFRGSVQVRLSADLSANWAQGYLLQKYVTATNPQFFDPIHRFYFRILELTSDAVTLSFQIG